jgi:hypothetical protein
MRTGSEMSNQPVCLRDHPLMIYRGARNWPPTWVKTDGSKEAATRGTLRGEIGTLTQVLLSRIDPYTRFYLLIHFKNEAYMGTLLFEDASFCQQIAYLLQKHCDESIGQIGNLDLSHLL